jgi:hypothetical protein
MAVDYLLTAVQVPALVTSAALHDPAAAVPTLRVYGYKDTTPSGLTLNLNQNNRRNENLGRYGGGAYAVAEGLDLVFTVWLVVSVTPGAAILDGPVVKPALTATPLYAGTVSGITDGVRNYCWILQDGSLTATQVLTPAPSDACAFLGSALGSGGGGFTGNPDYSGRWQLRGPQLYRRTADLGPPADSPSARVGFLSESQDGLYEWTGARYARAEASLVRDHYLTGEVGYIAPRTQQRLVGPLVLEAGARLVNAGRLIVE